MVDLFHNDHGYDRNSLAVICFRPEGSLTMPILRGVMGANPGLYCQILTAAK
jgi:hypothetical protein